MTALEDMRRFERIHDVVESVEEYRIGGYHPVHLGDVFHQRYEIIGKWAYGQFSTVWLSRDQLWVYFKVIDAQLNEYSHSFSPGYKRMSLWKFSKLAPRRIAKSFLSTMNYHRHNHTLARSMLSRFWTILNTKARTACTFVLCFL